MCHIKNLVVLFPLVSLFFAQETFAQRGTLTRRQQPIPDTQRLRIPTRQLIISPNNTEPSNTSLKTQSTRQTRSHMHRPILRELTSMRRPLIHRTRSTRPPVQAHRLAARPGFAKPLTNETTPRRPVRVSNISLSPLANKSRPSSTLQTRTPRGNHRTLSRKGPQNLTAPQPILQETTKTSPPKYTVTFQEMPLEYQVHVREKCIQKGCPPPEPHHHITIPHHSVKDAVDRCLKDLETNKPHLKESIKQGLIRTFESKGYR